MTGLAKPPSKRVTKTTTTTQNVALLSNYYKLELPEGKAIYEYLATFSHDIGLRRKAKLLNEHKELGTFATDGTHVYTPVALGAGTLSWKVSLTGGGDDDEVCTISLKKTKAIKGSDPDIWRVLNIVKKRLPQLAGMQQIGRNYFKMDKETKVAGVDNIVFYPGVSVNAVPIQATGAALVMDVLYKAVRKDTALDLISQATSECRGRGVPKQAVLDKVRGISVITLYSRRPYVIDDVDFSQTPLSTFEWKPCDDY